MGTCGWRIGHADYIFRFYRGVGADREVGWRLVGGVGVERVRSVWVEGF